MARPRTALQIAALLVVTVAWVPRAQAGKTRFGPEWTFTHPEILEASSRIPADQIARKVLETHQKRMSAAVRKRCPECRIDTFLGKFEAPVIRFTLPDGWWFQLSFDPSVIEVQADPRTVEGFKARRSSMQALVFDAAAEVGLRPHSFIGQGHFHLDRLEAFGGDRLRFRNYVVDKINHPELALGVFGESLFNAPPLSSLPSANQEAFRKLIAEFDADPEMPDHELIDRIRLEVYTRAYYEDSIMHDAPSHYQAVNLDHADTVELRYPRPQTSADDFIRMIEYEQSRIDYLEKVDYPIAILPQPSRLSDQEKVDRFYRTVEENRTVAGSPQTWEEARKILPSELSALLPAGYDPAHPQRSLEVSPPPRAPAPEAIVRHPRRFREVYDESGEPRPVYRGILERYRSLSPERIARLEGESRWRHERGRPIFPLPRLYEKSELETMQKGVEQRARALRALINDALSGELDAEKKGVLPAGFVHRLLARYPDGELFWMLGRDQVYFRYGPDLVRTKDGKWMVIDDRSGPLGDQGEASWAREQLLKHFPEYRPFLDQDRSRSFIDQWVESLRASGKPPGGEVLLFWGRASARRSPELRRQYEKAGIRILHENEVGRLRADWDGARLLLRSGRSVRVGAIVSQDVALSSLEGGIPGLQQALDAGAVVLGDAPGLKAFSDRQLTPYLEKLVKFYLREEPVLTSPETIGFARALEDGSLVLDEEALRKVQADWRGYVVKESSRDGGYRVFVGDRLVPQERRKLSRWITQDPSSYVAQKLVPLSEFEGHVVDQRLFSFVTPHDVVVSDQVQVRASPVEGNGQVRADPASKLVAAFTVDPSRFPPSVSGDAATSLSARIRSCLTRVISGRGN